MYRVLLFCCALGACAQFPALEGTVSAAAERADYPQLVPLETLSARTADTRPRNAQTEANLQSRVAALRARAARLKRRVIDPATRARMKSGVEGV